VRLGDFGLMTDQNIHPRVIPFLRSEGFDVLDVKEQGWHRQGDSTTLQRAVAENRVVVTHDADFGALAIQAGDPVVGLVYLRPGHIDPQFTIETIRSVLNANLDLTPPFVLVAKRGGHKVAIRIRSLSP
jgi:predicted nuclease of predicted toxin-antitoxin system